MKRYKTALALTGMLLVGSLGAPYAYLTAPPAVFGDAAVASASSYLEPGQAAQKTASISLDAAWRGQAVTLTLPEGMRWNANTQVDGVAVGASKAGGKDLLIRPEVSRAAGPIYVRPVIDIERRIEPGKVSVVASIGGDISQGKVYQIGRVGAAGFEVEAVPKTLIAGSREPMLVELIIRETQAKSLAENRPVFIDLKGAAIDPSFTPLIRNIEKTDRAMRLLSAGSDSLELGLGQPIGRGAWSVRFRLLPSLAQEGDITAAVSNGSQNSQEAVLASPKSGVTLKVGVPASLNLGKASQQLGDLTVQEERAGGLPKGRYELRVEPSHKGNRISGGRMQVNGGNLSASGFGAKEQGFRFDVNETSTHPSALVFSGLEAAIDPYAYDGSYKAVLYSIDQDQEQAVGEAVLFTIQNQPDSPPSDRKAVFTIGQTEYLLYSKGQAQKQTFDAAPFISQGRSMVSLKALANALDVEVLYEAQGRTITVSPKGGQAGYQSRLTIGSRALLVNGQSILMDTPPVIRNGRAFLPIAYFEKILPASITWDAKTQSVTVTAK